MPLLLLPCQVNARFHAQKFLDISNECIGYNALDVALDAFLDSEAFGNIPLRPPATLERYGRIKHLVSHHDGTIGSMPALEAMQALESCIEVILCLCLHAMRSEPLGI